MPQEQVVWYALHFLNQVMPFAAFALGVTLVSFTPLGRAAITWLKGHVNRGRAAELAGEIERLRAELGELQERVDFAERRLVEADTGRFAPSHTLPPAPGPGPLTPPRIPTPA